MNIYDRLVSEDYFSLIHCITSCYIIYFQLGFLIMHIQIVL